MTDSKNQKQEIKNQLKVLGVAVPKGNPSVEKLQNLLDEAKADPALRGVEVPEAPKIYPTVTKRDPSQVNERATMKIGGQPLAPLDEAKAIEFLKELKNRNPKKYQVKKWEVIDKYNLNPDDIE